MDVSAQYPARAFATVADLLAGQEDLKWRLILGIGLMTAAYFIVAGALLPLLRRSQSLLPFRRELGWVIAALALSGMVGVVEVLLFWQPYYELLAWVRVVCGAVLLLAVLLVRSATPMLSALSSPAQLQQSQQQMEAAFARRDEVERELRQTVWALNQSLGELEQFASITSHDLQTPLRTILGFSQLLQLKHAANLSLEGQEFVQYIVEGTRRMQSLVDDMLVLSRFGCQSPSGFEVRPLGQTLSQVVATLKPDLMACKGKVEWTNLPEIAADHGLLFQLFVNLINNSMKFRKPDLDPVIRISAQQEGEQILIHIADNGIGIPTEQLEAIFRLYSRGSQDGRRPGHGIGLAICRKIASYHGGRIWASATSQGATFHLRLPMHAVSNVRSGLLHGQVSLVE